MLQTSVDGRVMVEFLQFRLQDEDDPHHSALALNPPHGRRWLAVGGPGGAMLHSAGNDHYPFVRLELHDAEPPAHHGEPGTGWDDVTEVRLQLAGTTLQFRALTGEPWSGGLLELPNPGRYRLRTHVRGTAAARALGDASFAEDVEQWLMQLWQDRS